MAARIEEVNLHETAQERYLNYAMSVITSRALPDVRDGLKPVQRRILYAMDKNLSLSHDKKHQKSAKIVGEVMGKYHPHGDQSIYDAMVRMAQDFSLRYPLVDGHGNFGSVDGDSAAAMRYTEARMTSLSSELLDEIGEDTVEFRDNYDGTTEEPVVLPAQVPNLLINGATGIAVGMATNIPPHNLEEVVEALIKVIDEPETTVDELVGDIVEGPDFPTGGKLLNAPGELREIYSEGKGTLITRSQWEVEKEGRKRYIIITSVPYYQQKSALVEKIASHIMKEKVPQLRDVRDESTDEVRIVLELKRGSDPEAAMAYLFKHTPLENRFHVNLTCLVPSDNPQIPQPARVDLKEMLNHFLDFRMEVTTRRLEYQLRKLRARIHILEGFEIIFDALDRAIELIRSSESKSDAADKLMAEFDLDDDQADAILQTRLYRLAKLEIEAIRTELEEKRQEAARLEKLLDNEAERWALIRNELKAILTAYSDPRRTEVDVSAEEFDYSEEDYIISEKVWMMVSKDGRIKTQKSYTDISKVRLPDSDEIGWVLPANTRDSVIFFTSHGRTYTMRVDDVPFTTGHGDPVQAYFSFSDGERVVGVVVDNDDVLRPMEPEQPALVDDDEEEPDPDYQFVAITEHGRSVRFSIDGYQSPSTVNGRMFMRLDGDDQVVNVEPCDGTELVALASIEGRGLMFPVREISHYKGNAKGVRAIGLQGDDSVLDFTLSRERLQGLEVETNNGKKHIIRRTKSKFEPTSRGNKGRHVIKRGHLVRSHRPPVEMARNNGDDDE